MKTICITIGHNQGTGARAYDGTDEWGWNSELASYLRRELESRGYRVIILYRDKSLGYTAAMRKLAGKMKSVGADITLDLHFNASAPSANGFEFLHWWGSKASRKLAQCLGHSFGSQFPAIKKRGRDKGARSLWFHRWNERKAYSGRGGAYCYLTPCPAIICEPFFATNKGDWEQLKSSHEAIAKSYADGVDRYFGRS